MVKRLILLLLCLFWAASASAAVLPVQSKTCPWTSGTTIACTFNTAPLHGDLIQIGFSSRNSAGAPAVISTVVDSGGNTYSAGAFQTTGHLHAESYVASNPTAVVGTITITLSGTITDGVVKMKEWPAGGVPFYTIYQGNSGTSAAPSTGAVNSFVDYPPVVVSAMFAQESTNTYSNPTAAGGTAATTWTQTDSGTVSGGISVFDAYTVQPFLLGSQNYGAQVTTSGSAAWVAIFYGIGYNLQAPSVVIQGQPGDARVQPTVRAGRLDLGYLSSTRALCTGGFSDCAVAFGDDAVLLDAAPPLLTDADTTSIQELWIEQIEAANSDCTYTSQPYSCCSGHATTTSGAQVFPLTTLTVASTSSFASSGTLIVNDLEKVTYTGKGGTTFTGISGGSGIIPDGAHVWELGTGSCNSGVTNHGYWSPQTTNISEKYCTAYEKGPNGVGWPCCNGNATTLNGAQTLPLSTINVTSSASFPAATNLTYVINGNQTVVCSNTGSGTLTSCTGGTGLMPDKASVYQVGTGSCQPGGFSPIFEFLGTGFGSQIGAQPPVPTISIGNRELWHFQWDKRKRVAYPDGSWVLTARTINQPYGISCQGGGINIGDHPGNAGPIAPVLIPANSFKVLLVDNGGFFGGTTAGPGGVNVATNLTSNLMHIFNPHPFDILVTPECTCGPNQDDLCPPGNPLRIQAGATAAWNPMTAFGNQYSNINFYSEKCGVSSNWSSYIDWNATFNCAIPSN